MDKHMKIEGAGASRLVQLMRKHGYNKDVDIELATVLAPLPSLKVRLDSDGLELDRSLLVLTATVSASLLAVGDRVLVISGNDAQNYYVIDKVV